jgi:MoxR-like ATPase
MNADLFGQTAKNILQEVSKIIVGQDEVLRYVLICVLSGNHALLEGVPGLGKTTLVRAMATALSLDFSRIQFTPDLMPADVTGTNIMEETEEGRRAFRFQKGPIFANLVLADEVNRATPKTQSALLEAMQEKTVTVGNTTYKLEPPFFVLATQNPLEMAGTYALPEAQLDRFMFRIDVRFPDSDELIAILNRTTGTTEEKPVPVADGEMIRAMGAYARGVPVSTAVTEYVARLVVATHPDRGTAPQIVKDFVQYGSSPRGAQSILVGAKLHALLNGEYQASLSSVRAVAVAAMRHRLVLNGEAQYEGVNADRVITELIESISERSRA